MRNFRSAALRRRPASSAGLRFGEGPIQAGLARRRARASRVERRGGARRVARPARWSSDRAQTSRKRLAGASARARSRSGRRSRACPRLARLCESGRPPSATRCPSAPRPRPSRRPGSRRRSRPRAPAARLRARGCARRPARDAAPRPGAARPRRGRSRASRRRLRSAQPSGSEGARRRTCSNRRVGLGEVVLLERGEADVAVDLEASEVGRRERRGEASSETAIRKSIGANVSRSEFRIPRSESPHSRPSAVVKA